MHILCSFVLGLFFLPFSFSAFASSPLPIVNLGYVQQRATYFDGSDDAYVFKNIRYAHPPLGELRFRPPQPPIAETGIQDGSQYGHPVCAQPVSELSGILESSTISEDCLFLDIAVPRSVRTTDSVPVLVWIHGGAYTVGSKDGFYSATGFFKRTPEPIIYVALNYRLGAFGWLSPPNNATVPNIGLRDIEAALKWIQSYISLFGGDPNAVTVMGESAGGGSIMHLITAYGGIKQPPSFQQAIAQSPGYVPVKNNAHGRMTTFNAFLNRTGCPDIACLRRENSSTLIRANQYLTSVGIANGTGFGPVVDGDLIPDLPGKLILEGKFHHTLRGLISANNAHEGGFFVGGPETISPGDFDSFVNVFLPTASQATINALYRLYPPVPADDKLGNWLRLTDFIGDVLFNCNAEFLASTRFAPALEKQDTGDEKNVPATVKTYRYVFAVGSAIHGSDVDFTFYNGSSGNNYTNKTGNEDTTQAGDITVQDAKRVAFDMQRMITNFVVYGRPQIESFDNLTLPLYRPEERGTLVFNDTNLYTLESDPWKSARCDWWQTGSFAE